MKCTDDLVKQIDLTETGRKRLLGRDGAVRATVWSRQAWRHNRGRDARCSWTTTCFNRLVARKWQPCSWLRIEVAVKAGRISEQSSPRP